jgi:hypothetical protein
MSMWDDFDGYDIDAMQDDIERIENMLEQMKDMSFTTIDLVIKSHLFLMDEEYHKMILDILKKKEKGAVLSIKQEKVIARALSFVQSIHL